MVSRKDLKKLQAKAISSVEKNTGRRPLLIDEMDAKFGVPRYLSTGMPSLDLCLFHNDSRTAYGLPYGRVIEFHGAEQSFKTTMLLKLAATNIANGGLSFWNTSEYDFDASYIRRYLMEAGLEPDKNEDMFTFDRFQTIGDLFRCVQGVLEPFKELADEIEKGGGDPLKKLPPIFIGVDSIGALQGEENFDRVVKDFEDGNRVGTSANEFHIFFKTFLHDIARLGVAFVMTNHYRDNIEGKFKKHKPNSDAAVKYYCSTRLELNKGYDKDLTKAKTRAGRDFVPGQPLDINIYKNRVDFTLDGKIRLKYYHGYGFDYISSLFDAGRMSSVIELSKGALFIQLDEDDERFGEFDGKKFTEKDIRELLKSDHDLAIRVERTAFKRGPDKLEDLR